MNTEQFINGVQNMQGLLIEMVEELIAIAPKMDDTQRGEAFAKLTLVSTNIAKLMNEREEIDANAEKDLHVIERTIAKAEEGNERTNDEEEASGLLATM